MIRFVYRTLLALLILTGIISIPVGVYYYQMRNSLILSSQIDTIILGSSHTQNGINDVMLNGVKNFSSSGEAYIYSYCKLEYIVKHNRNINTVCLAYDEEIITQSIDSNWIYNRKSIFSKVGLLFPIMSKNELYEILGSNNFEYVISGSRGILVKSIYSMEMQLFQGQLPFIGGYTENNKKFRRTKNPEGKAKLRKEYSEIQLQYLNRIIDFCSKNALKLYLINTPKYGRVLPSIIDGTLIRGTDYTYLDYSNLSLGKKMFADYNHLNGYGADSLTLVLERKFNVSK